METNAQTNSSNSPKMPLGIKLILIYLGVGLVFSLFNFETAALQVGPVLVWGSVAKSLNLFFIVLVAAIFYGIMKRAVWAKKLYIGYLSVLSSLSLVNLVFLKINPALYDDYYRNVMKLPTIPDHEFIFNSLIFTCIVSLAVAGLLISYLLKRKDYFVK